MNFGYVVAINVTIMYMKFQTNLQVSLEVMVQLI